jgi:nucleotide-binding universal stress UspA family protein
MMMSRVLVALDGSPRSERSLPWARLFSPSRDLTLIRVLEPVYSVDPFFYGGPLADLQLEAERYLARVSREAAPDARTMMRYGSPAAAILEASREIEADLIALTTHGGSEMLQRILGSTAERLIRQSDCPLLVVPSWSELATPARLRRILVPLDGSERSESVLPFARAIGSEHDSEIVLAHVYRPFRPPATDSGIELHLQRLAEDLRRNWLAARVVMRRGEVVEGVLEAVRAEGADLILMSSVDRGGLRRLLFGSLTGQLLRESPVPMLVSRVGSLRPAVASGSREEAP